MTLKGIDVSHWQRTTPPLTGLSFAFAKASQSDWPDPLYTKHVAAFRSANLVVGAYHWGVGNVSPSAQVRAFLAVARKADIYALDLERDPVKTMSRAQGREFIRLLRLAAPGKTILLYSSRGTWPGDLGQDANWVADYTGDPNRLLTWPRVKWAFWQWTPKPWDQNRFNGDLAALRKLASLRTPTPVPAPNPTTNGRLRVDAGSWWDYDVSGTVGNYTIRRDPRQTDGFSASYSTVIETTWGGYKRKLAKLTSGVYANRWVDLNDVGSVQITT